MKASMLQCGDNFMLPGKEGVLMALYKLDTTVKCVNKEGETEYIDKTAEVMTEQSWPYNLKQEELCHTH